MAATETITEYIAAQETWKREHLRRIRELVKEAAPGVIEEWKWGSPVWSQQGMLCAASAFKEHVGINFFKGASLADPKGLFNAGLDAKEMRSIKVFPGQRLDEEGLKALVRAAVDLNASQPKPRASSKRAPASRPQKT